MSIPKQKYREIVFQVLFSQDIADTADDDLIPLLMKELSVTKRVVKEAQGRAKQIQNKIPLIDDMIRKTSTSYRFERIHTVERNVLRLGVYELLYDEEIPPKVAISEAMRLSKKFASPESSAFVNALLDAIYKSSLGEELDRSKLEAAADQLDAVEKETEEKNKLILEGTEE